MTTQCDNQERWLPVVGLEGYYEVSDAGRVRSVERVVPGRWGMMTRKSTMLKIHPGGGRYPKVTVCKDGVMLQCMVHGLVLTAFVGDRPEGHVCDHKDFDISNNNLSNLRWMPHYDNGVKRRNAKLSRDGAAHLRARAKEIGTVALAKEFGVSRRHVRQVVTEKRWT